MRYYQELTLIPNIEIDRHFLWSKLYQQLHLGLVEMQDERKRVPVGLSFPEYRMGKKLGVLGGKCRLFASDEDTLNRFNAGKWLDRLSDYVHWTKIRPVPEQLKGHAVYQRRQPVTSKERLARRYAKRHNLTFDNALMRYEDMPKADITLPFIRLHSLSTGREFCLWINKIAVSEPLTASFSTYGLSRNTGLPEF